MDSWGRGRLSVGLGARLRACRPGLSDDQAAQPSGEGGRPGTICTALRGDFSQRSFCRHPSVDLGRLTEAPWCLRIATGGKVLRPGDHRGVCGAMSTWRSAPRDDLGSHVIGASVVTDRFCSQPPAVLLASAGCRLLISASASPVLRPRCHTHRTPPFPERRRYDLCPSPSTRWHGYVLARHQIHDDVYEVLGWQQAEARKA